MNFLAHAWLAGDAPADRLGGLMGDFVKGPLPAGLPPDVAEGVRLHRQIDVFAETHPAFRRSRARVSPERRRVAGLAVGASETEIGGGHGHPITRPTGPIRRGFAGKLDWTVRRFVQSRC